MTSQPLKIIGVLEYYLPGFKGGGPIRTVANMRQLLISDVDLAIFTRDRDLGSDAGYESVWLNCWNDTKYGTIYYASPKNFSGAGLEQAIAGQQFDLIYLNSFFSWRASIQVYLNLRKSFPNTPILLAPRGEFSPGALATKPIKKSIFILLSRTLGLYKDVFWHASTAAERDDILEKFPEAAERIFIAEDPVYAGPDLSNNHRPRPSEPGQLRLAFISRISTMKNLDGLLRILAMTKCRVDLDIFGPIEDRDYWLTCKRLIKNLPDNVTASHKGELLPELVTPTFSGYDLFAFPTLGENFGHVIFEALRAGTPVLTSDRTPWKADVTGALSVIPISETAAWADFLSAAADWSEDERRLLGKAARVRAENFVLETGLASKNLSMFRTVSGYPNGHEKERGLIPADVIGKP